MNSPRLKINDNRGAISRFKRALPRGKVLFSKVPGARYNESVRACRNNFDIPSCELGDLLNPASDDFLGASALDELTEVGFNKLNGGPGGFPFSNFLVGFRESNADRSRVWDTVLHVVASHNYEVEGKLESLSSFQPYTNEPGRDRLWLLFPYTLCLPNDGRVFWDKRKEGSLLEAQCFMRDWRAVAVLTGLLLAAGSNAPHGPQDDL
jgi:hypothetical protein